MLSKTGLLKLQLLIGIQIFYFRYNGQNGYVDENSPSLAICYESGKLQFQCTFNDPSTIA
jgi:hypothetical protein